MFTPADLADGKYYWRVRAFNVNNEPGKWCSPRSLWSIMFAPLAPVLAAPADGITAKGTPPTRGKPLPAPKYTSSATSPHRKTSDLYLIGINFHPAQPPTQAPGAYVLAGARPRPGGQLGRVERHPRHHHHPHRAGGSQTDQPGFGSSTSNTTPDLSWNAVAYGHTYEIQIDNSFQVWFTHYQRHGIGGATYTSRALVPANGTGVCAPSTRWGRPGKWSSPRSPPSHPN
jgi:hypothetical protein